MRNHVTDAQTKEANRLTRIAPGLLDELQCLVESPYLSVGEQEDLGWVRGALEDSLKSADKLSATHVSLTARLEPPKSLFQVAFLFVPGRWP